MPEFSLIAASLFMIFWLNRIDFEKPVTASSNLKPEETFFLLRNYPDGTSGYQKFQQTIREVGKNYRLFITNKSSAPLWKTQGPYNIGGRINSIAHHPGNANTIYVGNVTGGIFKTTDAGKSWAPVFDQNAYLSVGCLVIDPTDTNVVYAGTGDPNISGYPWIGNGIYRSKDAGTTWEHLGLDSVGIVSKICINPNHPEVIYAATMGIPFERNVNRGLYKSIDGGETWQKVLYLSNETGIIDLAMVSHSPDTLFAAGWTRIRNYSESLGSGPECKIYRTFNGGQTWDTLSTNLPAEEMSRIGLCLSSGDSTEVLAQFINPAGYETRGIFRSKDYGDSWEQLDPNQSLNGILGGFGWYFAKIRVNPWNNNQIFVLGVDLYKSEDAGNSFFMTTPYWASYEVHADKHDLVFTDSSTILLSTDGGLYKSLDGGKTWNDIENIPNTQFYRVAVDPNHPGYYCGGAQDNGTSYGNINDSANWEHLFGGDGFQPLFVPGDTTLIYVETQNGSLYYGKKQTGDDYFSFDYFYSNSEPNRTSWDMPVCMDPNQSSTIYCGTYRVYENTQSPNNNGWTPISDDLTDGTETTFHVITALSVSSLVNRMIMAGTSDGRVHLFRNNQWTDISAGLPQRYVTCVRTSSNDSTHLFVSHSGYKDNEYIPHVHYSSDLGETWSDISGNMPQLAVNSSFILNGYGDSVIFAATDGGVYHTINRGQFWERSGLGMPVLPVYDLAYDDTNHTLVAGTFARSIMTLKLDDIIKKYTKPNSITEQIADLQVYPNPFHDQVTIDTRNILSPGNITITSLNGQVVFEQPISGSTKSTLNLSALKPGNYLLTIQTKNKIIATQKLIKQ